MSTTGMQSAARHSALAVAKLTLFAFALVGAGALMGLSLAPAAPLAASVLGNLDGAFDFPPLPDDLGDPWQRSVVYDREGNELAVLRDENRMVVDIDEVPLHVQNAVLATEDAEFRTHEGVNWRAIGRAAFSNLTAGEITGGGSTITQQLVKQLVLSNEQTLDRKVQEAVYAMQLEQRMSKDQILGAYLNEAYFGNRVYGIAAASEFYWGKDVGKLTVDEAAMLAGVLRAPAKNDPIDHPDRALARRNIVLGQMARAGFVTESLARDAQRRPLDLDITPLPEPTYPFFVDYVRELLLQDPALGPDRDSRERFLRRGGLEIHTTLHSGLQEVAGEVIEEVLSGEDDPMGVLVAIDPRTGEVLSMGVGPEEYGSGAGQISFNPAVPDAGSPGRQPGSSFKAFMAAAALEEGYPPGYMFEGGKEYEFENLSCNPSNYSPGNYGGATHDWMDLADATRISSNTYYAHLLDEVGYGPLFDVTRRLGLTTELRDECSVVLGTANVYPLEMASAFGGFANSGVLCEPYATSEVLDRDGRVLTRGGDECSRALTENVANQVTALLREPIEGGTASRNGQIGRPAAGKTGTTSDNFDAWFVGYVPQLSTASWVGYEVQREMTHPTCGGRVTGGCLPTVMWREFMVRAIEVLELEPESFPAPPPVETTTVPFVVGLQEDEAVEIIEERDLVAGIEEIDHWAPAGTVVAQAPDPNDEGDGGERVSTLPKGNAVLLRVSDGSSDEVPLMPDLVGLDEDEAVELLEEQDLEFDVETVGVSDREWFGRVVAHTPDTGEPLYESDGTTQRLIIIDVGRPRLSGEPPPETGTPGWLPPDDDGGSGGDDS